MLQENYCPAAVEQAREGNPEILDPLSLPKVCALI